MTPATPPRSRDDRTNVKSTSKFGVGSVQHKKTPHPETPHKASDLLGPVTPSTARHFKQPVPSLAAPSAGSYKKSPFKGFNSPEYTPQVDAAKNRPLQFEQQRGLQNVSRVLFPTSDDEEAQNCGVLPSREQCLLLPPNRPTPTRRKHSSDLLLNTEDDYSRTQHKQSKQVPGTPSHKIVTFEMAQKWHDPALKVDDLDDDDTDILSEGSPLRNPFQTSDVYDESIRQARKKSLITEHPDIENVITYVDKHGNVARRRQLSEQEKETYKPKRLFAKELKELGDERRRSSKKETK